MGKKAKQRRVDYSAKELLTKSSLNSAQSFDSRLKKFCEIYDIDQAMFKIYADEDYSPRFFPAEIGELLSISLKHLGHHPDMQKSLDKITISDLNEYFKGIVTDINFCEHPILTEIVSSYKSYQSTLDLIYWAPIILRELTFYLYNSIILENVSLGKVFADTAKHLDDLNFNFFCQNSVIKDVRESNTENLKAMLTDMDSLSPDYSNDDLSLDSSNLSIDVTLAILIKRFLKDTNKVKKDRTFEEYWNPEELSTATDHLDERSYYLKESLLNFCPPIDYNSQIKEACERNRTEWEPITDKIKKSDYSFCYGSLSRTELIEKYETEIIKTKDYLNELECSLECIKNKDESNFRTDNEYSETEKMANQYLAHYESVVNDPGNEYTQLQEKIDNFMGQILMNIMKIK